MNPEPTEIRQGKTGKWTYVLTNPEGQILATSEWGTNYLFAKKEWEELPLVNASDHEPQN